MIRAWKIAFRALQCMAPRPALEIWEWAEKKRILSKAVTAKPGKYKVSTAPYQREPQEAFRDPSVIATVLYWGSRLGKTESVMNAIGYCIDHDPQAMLVVYPTEDSAEKWSKKFFTPMSQDTPVIGEKMAPDKGRSADNTIQSKSFVGGNISVIGANSPSKFRQIQSPFVYCDEIDAMEDGREGDPVDLAFLRAKNYRNSIKILSSTPTIKDFSRIEIWFERSDQRKWFVPCAGCRNRWVIMWRDVDFSERGSEEEPVVVCPECGHAHDDEARREIVRQGEWQPTADFNGYRGYWLNGLNSLFPAGKGYRSRLHEIVCDFKAAKESGHEAMKTFINTTLSETWEEEGETVSDDSLMARREKYLAPLPRGVLLLTAGVDVQPDRLEYEVVGWGAGEESWSIEYRVIFGDPEIPEGTPGSPWTELAELKREPFRHEAGFELYLDHVCVDSGGHNTSAVYNFCKRHKGQRYFAIKGIGGEDKPIIGQPQRRKFKKKNYRPVDLYMVGVDQAKDVIYSRLRRDDPGPGYCHFPLSYDVQYFKQLTAEKKVTKYIRGYKKREWVKPDGRRNEALDCRVYAYAAMVLAAPRFDRIAYRLFHAPREAQPPPPEDGPVIEGKQLVAQKEEKPQTPAPTNKKRPTPRRRSKKSFSKDW